MIINNFSNINSIHFNYQIIHSININNNQISDNLSLSQYENLPQITNLPQLANLPQIANLPFLFPQSLLNNTAINPNLNNSINNYLLISLLISLIVLITNNQMNNNISSFLNIPNLNMTIPPHINPHLWASPTMSINLPMGTPFSLPFTPGNSINQLQPFNNQISNRLGGKQDVVNLALQQVGKPYVFGAEGPNAFDCSGLVQWVFKQKGINMPRTADQQFRVGISVPPNQLQAGDLVFFANTYCAGISHVGIYIGNGKFVHAANSRKGVIVSSLSESYWKQHYAGTKRV